MAEDLSKRFYVQNVNDWKRILNTKNFSDKELEVKIIKRGIILPTRLSENPKSSEEYEGGVCDNDFNFVAGFSRIDPQEKQNGGVCYY